MPAIIGKLMHYLDYIISDVMAEFIAYFILARVICQNIWLFNTLEYCTNKIHCHILSFFYI